MGPHAGELVGTLAVAMSNGIGLKKLANTVFAYPTLTEAIRKVADQYNRTRLTPASEVVDREVAEVVPISTPTLCRLSHTLTRPRVPHVGVQLWQSDPP